MNKKITWNHHSLDTTLFKIGSSYHKSEIRSIGSLPDNPGARENWGGIVALKNVVLIFVTLDKENADKNHKYNDYFDGQDFMWESQNENTIDTPSIRRIILENNNHLFIRISSRFKGETTKFTYAGNIQSVDFNDQFKPMQFQFECLDYQTKPNAELQSIYHWRPGKKFIPTLVSNPDRPKKRTNSQGYQRDKAKSEATEKHGMLTVKNHYESLGFTVEDRSMLRGIGYDFLCTKGKLIIEVEVKATTGGLGEVIITKNELDNALTSKNNTALAVVYEIELGSKVKKITAMGGKLSIIDNWKPESSELIPLSFRYKFSKEEL